MNKQFKFDTKALTFLKSYSWPGNIRELENLIERIVVLQEDNLITAAFLEQLIGKKAEEKTISENVERTKPLNLNEAVEGLEKKMIEIALSKASGNKFQAARELGLTRQNLRYKLKKYGIQ